LARHHLGGAKRDGGLGHLAGRIVAKKRNSKRPAAADPPPPRRIGWLRQRWLIATLALLAVFGLAVWQRPAAHEPATAIATGARALPSYGQQYTSLTLPAAQAREQSLHLLTDQYQLADHTLCSYRESSKYPTSSRPIGEHPDQLHPNAPIQDSHALRKDGGGVDKDITVQTAQTRVFLGAGEAAVFSVRAVDAGGNALPVVVTRAQATGITYKDARAGPQATLSFADDGNNGDAVAGDGALSGLLAPARSNLAGFNGTIRTEVKFTAGGKPGVVLFDVIYTPDTPATWSGPVRDVMADGSLVFVLKADIRQPGRYLASGRVDDANGKPFALVSFNEVLAAGPQDIKLAVFGKLLHDQRPAMPLALRDVDAYLLKENTDPDRAMMPRLEGQVAVSKNYALKGFADTEWQGEERSRYLAEFGKDFAAARSALQNFDPSLPLPPSECALKQPSEAPKP
jgi:hypothetical protein